MAKSNIKNINNYAFFKKSIYMYNYKQSNFLFYHYFYILQTILIQFVKYSTCKNLILSKKYFNKFINKKIVSKSQLLKNYSILKTNYSNFNLATYKKFENFFFIFNSKIKNFLFFNNIKIFKKKRYSTSIYLKRLNVKVKSLKKKKIINHMFYKLLSKNQFYRKLRYIVKKSYKNNKYKINKILKIIRLIKIKKKLFKGIFLNEIFFSELNLFTKKNKKFKKIMNFHGVRNLLAKKTYTTYNYFFRSYISISKRKIKKYLAVGRDSKLKRFIFKNPFKSNETYLNNLKNNLVFKNKSISVNNSKDGIALINNFFLHKKKLFIKPVQINPFSKIIFKKKKFNFFNLIKNFIFKNIFFLLR